MTISAKRRLNLNGTPIMVATIDRLLAAHGPFISRHRLMRVAMRVGLRSLDKDLGLESLRQLLVEDRAEAALK